MESEDYSFYQGLVFLLDNDINDLGYDLTFSTEVCWLTVLSRLFEIIQLGLESFF